MNEAANDIIPDEMLGVRPTNAIRDALASELVDDGNVATTDANTMDMNNATKAANVSILPYYPAAGDGLGEHVTFHSQMLPPVQSVANDGPTGAIPKRIVNVLATTSGTKMPLWSKADDAFMRMHEVGHVSVPDRCLLR